MPPPRPERMTCKRVALIALGIVVGALFVAPIVAEFVGAYRRGEQP